MLLIQLISIELILGIAAIGAVAAWKKSLGERLCLLGTIPISFALAFLVTKIGIWNFFGLFSEKLLGLFMDGAQETMVGTVKLTAAIINSVAAHLMFPLLFWIFLRVTAAIVRLILKRTRASERCSLFAQNASTGVRAGTCAIGAAHSFLILMLSLLPVVSLLVLPTAAVDRGTDPAYDGTYAADVVQFVNDAYVEPIDSSILMTANKLCGARWVLEATSDSISQKTIRLEDATIKVNSNKLTQVLLADGVTGMALYEYWCDPAMHTVDECSILADVLHDLSDEQILMQVGIEVANEMFSEEDESTADIGTVLLDAVKNSSSADMSVAFNSLGDAVELIAKEGSGSTLKGEQLKEYLIKFIGNEDNAQQLTQALAPSDVCCSALHSITEVGLGVICVTFDISDNLEEYYDYFLVTLEETVANVQLDEDDISLTEQFIKYTVQNDKKVAALAPKTDNPADTDAMYEAYQRYMAQKDSISGVFTDFLTISKNMDDLFISADGVVYVYVAKDDKWAVADSTEKLTNSTSMVAQLLMVEALGADEDMDIDDIRAYAEDELSSYLDGATALVGSTVIEQANKIRLAVISIDGFDVYTVYGEDIMSSVNSVSFKDALNSDGGIQSFARVLTSASVLLTDLSVEEGEDMSENMLRHFSDMGVIFDALCDFSSTEKVPENVLIALSTNKSYKKYFSQEAVNEMITNSNDGSTNYESIFASVETLFIIITSAE